MRAFAVGRLVPEGNEPIARVGRQVLLQPREHRTARRAAGHFGIQAYKVNIAIVE